MAERDDVVSYEFDHRTLQGPVHRRAVTPDMQWADYYDTGFCPVCLDRLSWNRTTCFADEDEDQCASCLVAWLGPDEEWITDGSLDPNRIHAEEPELKPCDRWKHGPGETFVLKAGVFDCIACPDGRWSILVRPLGSRFPEVVVRASKDEDLPQSLVHAQLACEGVFRCLLAEACGWIDGCCP